MDTLNRSQRERAKYTIFLICGLYHSFEQWCRILVPFSQWQLLPRPNLFDTLVLNSIGNVAILCGAFFIAQLIDSIGGKKTAIIATIFTAFYQIIICYPKSYYLFGFLQFLQFFNHMPTIIESLITQLVGENADNKERTAILMRTIIPTSLAFATGPYMAVQILYMFNPTLEVVQALCGILQLVTIIPILIFVLPEQNSKTSVKMAIPKFNTFMNILKNPQMLWSLIFIMLVSGPYSAYDQVIRSHLTSEMLSRPSEMLKLALILGSVGVVANIFLLPYLQRKLSPQRILQVSLLLTTFSYVYLAHAKSYYLLLLGMPLQVIGVCIALGQLSAHILASVPRIHTGKAAALNRTAQLAATAITPILTGYYIENEETSLLCYVSAIISLFAIGLIQKYGKFVGQSLQNLPFRND